jgi:hypothetical protein
MPQSVHCRWSRVLLLVCSLRQVPVGSAGVGLSSRAAFGSVVLQVLLGLALFWRRDRPQAFHRGLAILRAVSQSALYDHALASCRTRAPLTCITRNHSLLLSVPQDHPLFSQWR